MQPVNSIPRRASSGFTLVELMVVIVIGAILATIAVPAYTGQIRKSRRTEARTAVLDLASREERFMSTRMAYSATPTDLGYAAFPVTVASGYYSMAAPTVVASTAIAPATFTVTASPVSGKGQDKDTQCASFSVDSTGKQSALNSGGTDSTAACWN
jgi:type IV pilus assembly protein PilE